jgi:hypothetical protein
MLIALAPVPGIGSAMTCPERKSLPKENGGRRQALGCTVCFRCGPSSGGGRAVAVYDQYVSMPRAEVFSAIEAS